jgi:regulatory protein
VFPKAEGKAGWVKLDRGGGPESSKSSRVPTRPLSLEDGPVAGRVTRLVEHSRKPGRYRVAVADESGDRGELLADAALIQDLRLRVGRVIDAAEGRRLVAAATVLAAVDAGLAALARRGRSRRELERWLLQRTHTREDVRLAIERLSALGLLDDERYARSVARSKMAAGKLSRRRIAMELARRGIEREVADRVMREAVEAEGFDECGALEAAAARRSRALASLEPAVARRRLMGFLLRRGFDGDAVRDVVRRHFGGIGTGAMRR